MLTRKTAVTSVLVSGQERKFLLKAHSIAEQLNQIEIQERGRLMGLEMAEESIGTETTMTMASKAYLSSLIPILIHLLSEPADDGQPLTEEDFWNLDSHDPERVIAEQEELTAMESVLGNGLALQRIAGQRFLEREKLKEVGLKSE